MKQTAVEWLEEKFNNNNANFINWSEDYFNEAKEMEKQQQGYSEEEVKDMVSKTVEEFCVHLKDSFRKAVTVEWFEQIKKK
jgi:hypothetical protein